MSTTIIKFVDRCYDIVKAKPEYALGCSSKTKCDCIGMVKYGLHQNGVSFSTSGTNWTFRKQVRNIRKITGASVLQVGDVVFKSRAPGESGYNLPSKYRQGGTAYNGDLNDYCHIGVVKSVKSIRIIHMTSPTSKEDTSIGKWKWAAELLPEYIRDYGSSGSQNVDPVVDPEPAAQEPVITPAEPVTVAETAVVIAPSGRWVKMRAKPSTGCRLYDEVPIGATVTVETHGYEWTKISYGRRKGWYMMTKFLAIEAEGTVG